MRRSSVYRFLLAAGMLAIVTAADLAPDTWVATDGLGRRVPIFPEVPAPRADRTVGIFYFLWHGAHIQGGPYDVSRILAEDPGALRNAASPLWGPLHAPHHWGESIFGYYLTQDEAVLRKHAQMLADAGVDVVIFDVTNQVTYRDDYMALLRVWSRFRDLGNATPQVAFLTPFWDPAKVTRELWRDLYVTGAYRDLWFQWEGKPLLLADPELIYAREENAAQNTPAELQPGHTLGQSFTASRPILSVSGRFPTWRGRGSSVLLTLRRGGEVVVSRRFQNVADNEWLRLKLESAAPPGEYYLEASEPQGTVGWWSHTEDKLANGTAFLDGRTLNGDRTLRLEFEDEEAGKIRDFFTFRKPQPDYFRGPTQAKMWSWLEVFPQHRFTNSAGENEQMSVGVAQNAVRGRLGSMSEPGAQGRSFHNGQTDPGPGAVRLGLNVTEQWERVLKDDPRFVFVTGWNEWIAGRFAEFNGVKHPVMFVDQFDQEHSRDIEPMRGGHGDDYYYQLASYVRRFKGARPIPLILPGPIEINGVFKDWQTVQPAFRDTVGDPVRREHRGWDSRVIYRNHTGRNDLVEARVSWNRTHAFFYVRAAADLTIPRSPETNWMNLLIDIDADARTGWLGYDFIVNRTEPGSLERYNGAASHRFEWATCDTAAWKIHGTELELSIPWTALGRDAPPAEFDFKWADHCFETGDWQDFTLNGDTAPNDRFNYRARLK